jgi:hypothetical protein
MTVFEREMFRGSDGIFTTLVERNSNEAIYGDTYCGVWQGFRLAGLRSLESSGQVCVGAFDRNLALFVANIFSRLIYFKKHFMNCLFSVWFEKRVLEWIRSTVGRRRVHLRQLWRVIAYYDSSLVRIMFSIFLLCFETSAGIALRSRTGLPSI